MFDILKFEFEPLGRKLQNVQDCFVSLLEETLLNLKPQFYRHILQSSTDL